MFKSLKNKLWLTISGVSVTACGLLGAVYFAISQSTSEITIAAAAAFVLALSASILLGRWLANEAIRPVEKVNLAAKSLERNPTATLPTSTGASETDDLMRSLHRNSSQLQNLIMVMDDVAIGKTAEALRPFQDSDRLTVSFQKLVSKVTDSIDAKNELDEIRQAISRLSMDIAPVSYGNLNVEIRTDSELTREVAEVLIHLVRRLDIVTRRLRESSTGAVSALGEIRDLTRSAVELDAARSARFGRAFTVATQAPDRFRPLLDQFGPESVGPAEARRKFSRSLECASDCAVRLGELRAKSAEAHRKYQRLHERLIAIPRIARSAEELARRSNLIALNSAISEKEIGIAATASGEINRLSARAEKLSKEMAEFCKAEIDEANEVDAALNGILSEIAELTIKSAETSESLSRFDTLLAAYLNLPAVLSEAVSETDLDRNRIDHVLNTCRENDSSIRAKIEESARLICTLLGRFEEDADAAANNHVTPVLPNVNPTAEGAKSSLESLQIGGVDNESSS